MLLAIAAEEITFWQVSLAVGAVVLIVVIALLGLLTHLVGGIEAGGHQLLGVAGTVAGNTDNIKVALDVVARLDEVIVEAGKHARLLGV